MNQQQKLINQPNFHGQNILEALYITRNYADVRFNFFKNNEKLGYVMAHKYILSMGNEVFHTIFYGALKENGDIRIDDVTPEAFNEFLQFFYTSNIALTSQNIIEVAYLCKKYSYQDGLITCETAMKTFVSIDNICASYEAAMLLDLHDYVQFCENRIKIFAKQICSSVGFLETDRELFNTVIKLLIESDCNSSVIVNACMNWAKAKCEQNDVESTTANLKKQIKDIIGLMPFDKLKYHQFRKFTFNYEDFFAKDEYDLIVSKLLGAPKPTK